MKSVLIQHRTRQKRARMRRFFVRFGILFLAGGGSILFLLLSPRFQFGLATLSGNTSISSEDITRAADRFLSGRAAWLFPRSSVLLFRPDVLEAHILKEFPRLATAEVSRSFSRELALRVSERSLWGLYCKNSQRDCYYIAEDGVLVMEAPQLTGSAIFRIMDQRTKAAFYILGDAVMSESDAAFLRNAADVLRNTYRTAVREVVLGREFQDQTELATSEGWYVLFDERTNKERALENLELVLNQHITDRSDLEYVDIRFEGKVFYKRSNH